MDQPAAPDRTPNAFQGPRRYVDRAGERFTSYREAARNFPSRLNDEEARGLLRKPFSTPAYYVAVVSHLLGVLDHLALEPGALVVDAGAGSGWVSELLLGLQYRVLAVEPSAAMIEAARERIARFDRKHDFTTSERIAFIASTLEEMPPPAAPVAADAVLFSEAFHHVIDEDRAAATTFDLLKEGGQLAILGESRWLPGNQEQAAYWDAEMDRYGTLESPFTRDYMRFVLERAGFVDVEFHHAVNCLVPVAQEDRPVREFAGVGSADHLNTVTARRPRGHPPIEANPERTAADLVVDQARRGGDGMVQLRVRLFNRGETVWPHRPTARGWVTLALFGRRDGGRAEAGSRARLPNSVLPGASMELTCEFGAAGLEPPFELALVSNDHFWFRETAPVPL